MSSAPARSFVDNETPAEAPLPRGSVEDTIATYDRVADAFEQERSRVLFERAWLDHMIGVTPRHAARRRGLDLGCGTGQPIGAYLSDRGLQLTGVDGSEAMLDHFRRNLPSAEAVHSDMRSLALGRPFDAILAWNSFFHLPAADQAAMFPVFRRHAAPGAALMFTSGPEAGERWGSVGGSVVYHASLGPADYERLMAENGFRVVRHVAEDETCNRHTVWLARFDLG